MAQACTVRPWKQECRASTWERCAGLLQRCGVVVPLVRPAPLLCGKQWPPQVANQKRSYCILYAMKCMCMCMCMAAQSRPFVRYSARTVEPHGHRCHAWSTSHLAPALRPGVFILYHVTPLGEGSCLFACVSGTLSTCPLVMCANAVRSACGPHLLPRAHVRGQHILRAQVLFVTGTAFA